MRLFCIANEKETRLNYAYILQQMKIAHFSLYYVSNNSTKEMLILMSF